MAKYQSPIIRGNASAFNPTLDPNIQRQLNSIKPAIKAAQKLLKTNVDDLNPDEITDIQHQIRPAQYLYNQIKRGKMTFKRRLNKYRDYEVDKAMDLLNNYGFDELHRIYPKLKALKNDLWAKRRNDRWQQLRSTFEQAIQNNPIISDMAPILTDMGNFRAFYPKLVSSSKNGHITQTTRGKVNNIVHQWASDLKQIKQNLLKLDKAHQNNLLNEYIQNPAAFQHNELIQFAMEQKQDQTQAKKTQSSVDLPWLESLLRKRGCWQKLHSNNAKTRCQTQAWILYDMFNNLLNPESVYYKHTHRQAGKIIADVKYIINQ